MSTQEGIFKELGFDPQAVRQPEGAIVYALARTYGLVIRRLTKIYKRFDLSSASFNLLLLLQRGQEPESFTQQVISERLVVSPSDMTGLIDRLERRGLVRRIPGRDRRTNLLRITPKGVQLVERIWPHHAEEIRRLSLALSVRDAQLLGRVLAQLRGVARN